MKRACHATMPADERARPALRVPTALMAEMAERSAGNLDLAFRHADSRSFEGEAASVVRSCAF